MTGPRRLENSDMFRGLRLSHVLLFIGGIAAFGLMSHLDKTADAPLSPTVLSAQIRITPKRNSRAASPAKPRISPSRTGFELGLGYGTQLFD